MKDKFSQILIHYRPQLVDEINCTDSGLLNILISRKVFTRRQVTSIEVSPAGVELEFKLHRFEHLQPTFTDFIILLSASNHTMSINHITGGGGGLGSESAGTIQYSSGSFVECGLQPAANNGDTSHGPTLALHLLPGQLPPPPPENNRHVHLSLVCPRRGLVTGVCVQEGGKMSSSSADDCQLYRACAMPSVSTDTHGLQP